MRNRTKNYNMEPDHRKLLLANMVKSYGQNGYIETTFAKAKKVKQLLEKQTGDVVRIYKVGVRKGDGAQIVRLVSDKYLEAKFSVKKTKK
jgi:ribosomal protein L17